MKYFIVARHANWLGTPHDFQSEADNLSKELKTLLGNLKVKILTSIAKRSFETGLVIAKHLDSEPPVPRDLFLGNCQGVEIREYIQRFSALDAVIVVCHEENSRFVMEHIIQMLQLKNVEIEPLNHTGTAYVLDCESGSIKFIGKTSVA